MIMSENLTHFKTLNELQEGLTLLNQQKAAMLAETAEREAVAAEQAQREAAAAELAGLTQQAQQAQSQWADLVIQFEAAVDKIQACVSAMKEISGWERKNATRLSDAGLSPKLANTQKIADFRRYGVQK